MSIRENSNEFKVLMVDDDANVLESHRRLLRSHCSIHTALGGLAALEAFETSGPFAVVVSDIKMPIMGGIELLAKIKTRYPETIRMVLTGYADLEMAISVVNKGDIFRFLTKPCDLDDLVGAIMAGIDQYKMSQVTQELAILTRLKEGLEGTLQAFTRLVEFRDPYTAGHMGRVALMAGIIAERMSLESDRVQGLKLAARVHDIGKVAVPAGILNKPGPLNEAEFSLIKAHSLVGAEIFKTLDTAWPISRMILEHHERLDGTGYPNGLKSDAILLESKVLAVADVADAIMTHRPYRQSLGPQEVVRFLTESKGTLFDGKVVDVVLTMLENDPLIKKEYN